MPRRARVRMTLTAAAGAVALAIAAPTSASAAPIAGCPAHWSTTTALNHAGEPVSGGLWLADDANEQLAAPGFDLNSADINLDGLKRLGTAARKYGVLENEPDYTGLVAD